jgi:hypothetical protein
VIRQELSETRMTNQAVPHARSAREIKEIIEIERSGDPFVLWRDQSGDQHVLSLGSVQRATVGRGSSCDLVLREDTEVSRTHAELEFIGDEWAVADDGLSRNGTFVNGVRISGRKRLADGDVIRFGATSVEYRCPAEPSADVTSAASHLPLIATMSDTQKRILVALCRPYKTGAGFATPASNSEIAAQVFLSVDAVKTHLRTLFRWFEISDLPQNQKRARLVECAFQLGLVTERDL